MGRRSPGPGARQGHHRHQIRLWCRRRPAHGPQQPSRPHPAGRGRFPAAPAHRPHRPALPASCGPQGPHGRRGRNGERPHPGRQGPSLRSVRGQRGLHPAGPCRPARQRRAERILPSVARTGDQDLPHPAGTGHRPCPLLPSGTGFPDRRHRREQPLYHRAPVHPAAVHSGGPEAQHAPAPPDP